MKNFFLCILSLNIIFLAGCSSVCRRDARHIERYSEDLASLIATIRSEKPDLELIKESSLALMDRAEPIYLMFVKKNQDCRPMLKQVLDEREKMLQINLEAIERDYHEGQALVAAPDHCYHAKELVVHPATVYLLAQEEFNPDIREAMLDELIELDSHMGEFLKDNE